MIKILKYTEYLYLIVAVLSLYKIFSEWNTNREGTYLFIFFAIISTAMFLFRRRYRQKFEKRNQDKP
ncbi:hypothetical protein [Spongiimicrobium salis]|uniref:hypothetical protein n=1 Tax=Spongiimicrobium salis TaxID=1667022 RepID=UPI00374DDDE6